MRPYSYFVVPIPKNVVYYVFGLLTRVDLQHERILPSQVPECAWLEMVPYPTHASATCKCEAPNPTKNPQNFLKSFLWRI